MYQVLFSRFLEVMKGARTMKLETFFADRRDGITNGWTIYNVLDSPLTSKSCHRKH